MVTRIPIIRLYGGAIGVVSGLYAILVPGVELLDMAGVDSGATLSVGGWVMLAVGVAALIHGILLFTPLAADIGRISGPLMLVWATIMVGNQALVATVTGWGMAGSGMGGGMDGAMSSSMGWDPGMVTVGILMFVSGLIMIGRRSGESA